MQDPETVTHETMYQATYLLPRGELRKQLIGLLRQGHKLRRPLGQGQDRRGSLPDMVSVHERPACVFTRELPGDWERDLIKGAGNASCIGTIIEHKTRYVILAKMNAASADAALSGFSHGLSRVPKAMCSSMTYDQGKEMVRHKELARRWKIRVYFCDPHSPWDSLNNRPRQTLGFRTPLEAYQTEIANQSRAPQN